MRHLSLPGILIGATVDFVASTILGVLVILPFLPAQHPASYGGGLDALEHAPLALELSFAVGAVVSVIAGYIAAAVAKHDEILNGALSSILCEVQAMWLIASPSMPHTGLIYQLAVASLCAGPMLGAVGGWIRRSIVGRRPAN